MQEKKDERYHCIFGPGYLAVSDHAALLCSVCGAGVIVTVWDRLSKKGGMAHCLLASTPKGDDKTNFHLTVALSNLLARMQVSSRRTYLHAQIFGGGSQRADALKQNAKLVAAAKKLLMKANVAIISEDVGGLAGRKVMFDTSNGDAMVLKTKKIRKSDWAPEYLIDMEERGGSKKARA
jgi:chemotaxis protein CheD